MYTYIYLMLKSWWMELDPAPKTEYGQCASHILTAVTPIVDMALLFGWPPRSSLQVIKSALLRPGYLEAHPNNARNLSLFNVR